VKQAGENRSRRIGPSAGQSLSLSPLYAACALGLCMNHAQEERPHRVHTDREACMGIDQ